MSFRRFVRALPLACFIIFMVAASAAAVDRHVPADFPTIQSAMDAASPGDAIFVAPGVYGRVNFGGKDVSLVSSGGPGVTTLDGSGGRVVSMGPGGLLSGFTIAGGNASDGAGVRTSGVGSRIVGNTFDGNAQSAGGFGAAIGGNVSSPIIEQNVFRNNTCDDQFLSGVVSYINGSSPIITNNLFVDNECRAVNLRLPSGANPQVTNNTMVRNRVGLFVSRGTYRNNILVDNGVGFYGGNMPFENNLVYGNDTDYVDVENLTGTNGNISTDPLFVDPLGDFRLSINSPAIDAGTSVGAPSVDINNDPRPIDGNGDGTAGYDIGAYEGAVNRVTLTFIANGAVWKYLDDGSNQGTAWRASDFDDALWAEGPGQLGYGDFDEATQVNCGPNSPACATGNFATTYFRHTFAVERASLVDSLTSVVLRDDAAAVYINGVAGRLRDDG